MNKKIGLAILFISAALIVNAQSPIGKGGKQLNFGLGLNNVGFPVYVGYEVGVHEDITVGGQVGLDLDFNYINVGGRGDYHFNTLMGIPQDWDFYAGANLGVAIGLDDSFSTSIDLGLQVGGRYYWNSDWGVNLEVSGGTFNGGRIGVSKRF